MPLSHNKRMELLRRLDDEYQEIANRHYNAAPRGGAIPVGGGDWMDTHFRMEAIRGLMSGLRQGKSIDDSIKEGQTLSEIAVQIWNSRREWQVHRWVKCCHGYLDSLVRRFT